MQETEGQSTNQIVSVTHLMRCPQENLHSIERLYETVRNNLPPYFQTRVVNSRINSSPWIIPLLIEAWRVSHQQTQINHVTGGSHFLILFTCINFFGLLFL